MAYLQVDVAMAALNGPVQDLLQCGEHLRGILGRVGVRVRVAAGVRVRVGVGVRIGVMVGVRVEAALRRSATLRPFLRGGSSSGSNRWPATMWSPRRTRLCRPSRRHCVWLAWSHSAEP